MRAILYTRQSRISIEGDEAAVTRQAEDGRKLAQLRGWIIGQERTDNDITASGKRERPGFEALIVDIASGEYGAVIAWSLDRLTRNARDRLRLIEACSQHGVTIALVRGSDIDPATPGGRLVAGILGEVAEHEIRQKGDRQRRAAQQAADAGRPYGGRRPFGFEVDKVTIRPDEAEVVRQAFQAVLDGVPLGAIARKLNGAGWCTTQPRRGSRRRSPDGEPQAGKPRRGDPSPWTAVSLRGVLTNPRYAGRRAVTVRPGSGRPTWQEVAPAAWEPIVSTEVFEAVGSILSDPSRRTAPLTATAGLLTGLALCSVCHATVHGGRASTMRNSRNYRCSAAYGHLGRQQEPVDWFVSELVIGRLGRPDAAELFVPERPDLAPVHAELAAARRRLAEAPKLWAEGVLSDVDLRRVKSTVADRIAELEATLSADTRVTRLAPLVSASDVRAAWEALDVDRRRAVIDVLMSVEILPAGRGTRYGPRETWAETLADPVTVVWKVPG